MVPSDVGFFLGRNVCYVDRSIGIIVGFYVPVCVVCGTFYFFMFLFWMVSNVKLFVGLQIFLFDIISEILFKPTSEL
jgi:hypothetical protein